MAPLDIPLWWMLFCSTQYSEVICEDGQVHGGEDDNTVVGEQDHDDNCDTYEEDDGVNLV